ncbi:hypothetical protein E2C01_024870 [Portunus trituberculatus]|uniref:Uncharacterized protein n=1 Tax=Portunus trituberculatus TaxID=210409 RepID=A0A5B7EDY8_PORTR|nr:hypothetical protein [Portunus trituberculatus]
MAEAVGQRRRHLKSFRDRTDVLAELIHKFHHYVAVGIPELSRANDEGLPSHNFATYVGS